MSVCSCGTGLEFTKCCGPILSGDQKAPTAVSLMRARYSAYTKGNIDFIVDTTHPDHRADMDVEEITNWSKKSNWLGLEIVDAVDGEKEDSEGVVEFKAKFEISGQPLVHHERSDFTKVDGSWFFVDGQPIIDPIKRSSPKIGRNDPCSCGSGKKYKKCCGK